MKSGRISDTIYKRSVQKYIKNKSDHLMKGVGRPGDGSVVRLDDAGDVLSTTTFTNRNILHDAEAIGVITIVNELGALKSAPLGILVSLVLPPEYPEEKLKTSIGRLDTVCAEQGIPILDVHVEVSSLNRAPLIHLTGLGRGLQDEILKISDCRPGQDIVMSKHIGLGGTWLIGQHRKKELQERFSQRFMMEIDSFHKELSTAKEAFLAGKSGVTAMMNVREFGIFGALWNLGAISGSGIRADLKKIDVRQETIEICEFYGLNPYQLMSEGALLMITDDGNALAAALRHENIAACVIGRLTEGNDRVVINDGEERYLTPPQNDEITKLI